MPITIAILSVLLVFGGGEPNRHRQDGIGAGSEAGPKCDGVVDDTARIQQIVDAALKGNHHVHLPAGVCIVAPPNQDYIVKLGSDLTVEGEGPTKSVLKIKDGSGDYQAIFGPKWAKLANLTLKNLAIDYNSTQNEPKTYQQPRFVISTQRGSSGLVMDNIFVRDIDSINAIYSASENTTIRNCRFEMSISSTIPHDHSTIYIAAEKSLVEGNRFVGALNRAGSVTAIEIHGGKQVVQHNLISGYFVGMNVTGIAPTESRDLYVADNRISGTYHGIDVWSNNYRSHTAGVGMSNAVITKNEIAIAQRTWVTDPVTGKQVLGNASGIAVDPNSNLPLVGLKIDGNSVEYEAVGRERPVLASSGMGIGYWDATGVNRTSDVTISNNRIVNAPATAIRWAVATDSLRVEKNQIVEAGCSTSESLPRSYSAAIMVVPPKPAAGVFLTDNEISASECTLAYGIEVVGESCVVADGNTVNATGKAATGYLQYAYTSRTGCTRIVRGVQVSPPLERSMLPRAGVVEGSVVTGKDGEEWRYNGAGWIPAKR